MVVHSIMFCNGDITDGRELQNWVSETDTAMQLKTILKIATVWEVRDQTKVDLQRQKNLGNGQNICAIKMSPSDTIVVMVTKAKGSDQGERVFSSLESPRPDVAFI